MFNLSRTNEVKGLAVYVIVITCLIIILPCVALLAGIHLSLHSLLIHPVIASFYLILACAALSRGFNTSRAIMVWDIISVTVLIAGTGYIIQTQGAVISTAGTVTWLNIAHWISIRLLYYVPSLILSGQIFLQYSRRGKTSGKDNRPAVS
jgi:hypothetical protein